MESAHAENGGPVSQDTAPSVPLRAVPAAPLNGGKLRVPESWRFVALGIGLALSIAMVATGKWHSEDYAVIPFYIALPWFGPGARRLSASLTPFLMGGILYDLYGLLLPLRTATVHVSDLYLTDLALFGVPFAEGKMLIADFLALHSHPVLDVMTGAAYILYLGEVFALALWFHFKDPQRALIIGLGFLVMNLFGMVAWFVFPAAPPWYVTLNGLGPANLHAIPSPAGAARFDTIFHVSLFHNFYSRSINVFGAMPSLHSAYPTLVFLASRTRSRVFFAATLGFALLIFFSAMYLQHHYALDVIAGISTGYFCFAVARAAAKRITARVNGRSPA